MARKYELKKRAQKQEETRRRIVDALVALHEEVGPANTTVKAVAERAGVQRLTVYRHFPDEHSMFQACTAQYDADNPPPNPMPWMEIEDPIERLRTALDDIYDYYARAERMISNALRDAPEVPALADSMHEYYQGLEEYRKIIAAVWNVPADQRARLDSVISHAIWFETWRSMCRVQELTHEEAIELMVRFATCIAASER